MTHCTPQKPANFKALIVALGDIKTVSESVGKKYPTVAGWKNRNSIPAPYWPKLLTLAKSKRVSINEKDLVKMAGAA